VNPALAGVALVVIAGAVVAGSAKNGRTAILGLVVALVAAPLLADPPAAPLGLAARLVAAVLAGYLLWVATRGPAARTGGTLVGWPTEAFLAIAAAVVGYVSHGLGAPGLGPPLAAAAGYALRLRRSETQFHYRCAGRTDESNYGLLARALAMAASARGAIILKPAAFGCRPSSASSRFRSPLSSTRAVK